MSVALTPLANTSSVFQQFGTGAILRTVTDKLKERVSTADYYLAAESDSSGMFQRAIDAVNAAGGGCVEITEAGTYYVKNLSARNNVLVRAKAFGAVTLKVTAGYDAAIFINPNATVPTTVDFFGLENLILDGNVSASPRAVARSACAVDGVTYFYARNCIFQNASGYGLAFQAYPLQAATGVQTDIVLENCYFLNNGIGTGLAGADTYDGLDIKNCDRILLIKCRALNNYDRGINIRGKRVMLVDCDAEGNGFYGGTADVPVLTAGIEIVGNSDPATVETGITIIGGAAYGNGGAGYAFSNGNGSATQKVRVSLQGVKAHGNGTHGIEVQATSGLVELLGTDIHTYSNTNHGISTSSTAQSVGIKGLVSRSNGGSGVFVDGAKVRLSDVDITLNTRYGIEEGASGTRTIVGGASSIISNTMGNFLWNANARRTVGDAVVDYDVGSGDIIASASTITLPEGGEVFYVTGTTNINTITAGRRGRKVTLHFTGVLTVGHATGNIRLDGASKTTANRHQLTLTGDGTSWFMSSYSATV